MNIQEYENAIRSVVPEALFKQAEEIIYQHKPTNPLFENIEAKSSPQRIMQQVYSLRYYKEAGETEEYNQLLEEVRNGIASHCGVDSFNRWLRENDPENPNLDDVKDLDTGILR